MMGTKDYNAIAGVLKAACKYALTRREKQMLLGLASEIAGLCHRQNDNFQRQRFMDATGTNEYLDKEV
jgi:hypothetical protein